MTIDQDVDCVTSNTTSSTLELSTKYEEMDIVGEGSKSPVSSNNIRSNNYRDIKVLVIVAYSMEMKVPTACNGS